MKHITRARLERALAKVHLAYCRTITGVSAWRACRKIRELAVRHNIQL